MARRRHLIAYDIAESKRLRAVIKVMTSFGTRLQYSVFLCDLSPMELITWRTAIITTLDLVHDSVVVIDLGPLGQASIEVMGKPRTFPPQGTTIV